MEFIFPYKTIHLNEEQSNAVLRPKDCNQRILASAGSGKTTTLTARIAYLITHYNVNPESIILMTFSKNASQQMIGRIESLIGKTKIYAGTFHSLSKQLLREHDSTKLSTLYFIDELIAMGFDWLSTVKGRKWVSTLRYIIIDEFQDINTAQWKMVERMLHVGARLLVVGDDAQNIYTWRGSDVKFILELDKKIKNLVDDQLRINYRSSNAIINVANSVMNKIPTLEWKKSMQGFCNDLTKEKQRPDVHFFWRLCDETNWVIKSIKEIRKKQPLLTIAILSRTNIDLYRIEEEISKHFIPYRLFDLTAQDTHENKEYNPIDLVTIHTSKGLEWDVVFLLHCNDDTFPSNKTPNEIICERRLFYVAVTRPKRHLIITYTRNERELSRFVREIPSKYLQYHGLAKYCLSDMELNSKTPKLEFLISSLDGDDYTCIRKQGLLNWLDILSIQQTYLYLPGDSWILPVWARRSDISMDFMNFIQIYIKRLLVDNTHNDTNNSYRDPLIERVLFTLRIYSEDKEFWNLWKDELNTLMYMYWSDLDGKIDIPTIDYGDIQRWSKNYIPSWTSKEILSATCIIAKIRGQLRPIRFENFKLNEFTMKNIRFTVPTESRADVLRSWRKLTNSKILNFEILSDIWKISTLKLVADGRNAPLFRVNLMKQFITEDKELHEYLESIDKYFKLWYENLKQPADIQIGIEIECDDICQPEQVDIFADGVFWRIVGEEKERINTFQLLILAILAGFAQKKGMKVHSVGLLYPLEGRSVKVHLPPSDIWVKMIDDILKVATR